MRSDHDDTTPEELLSRWARELGMPPEALAMDLVRQRQARAALDAAPPVADAYVARGRDPRVRRARQRHQRLLIERAARQRVRLRRPPAVRLPAQHVVLVRPVARARRVQRDSGDDGDGDADPPEYRPRPATASVRGFFVVAVGEVRS